MKPYYETDRGKLFMGDCLEVMRKIPDESVNCGITSPPYWGLRDYGEVGQLGLEKTPEEYTAKLVEVFREFKRVLRDDGTLWLNLGDSYAVKGIMSKHGGQRANRDQSAMGVDKRDMSHGLKSKNLVGIPWRVAFALQADGWYLRQDIIWHKPNPMPESVTDRCTKAHEYIFLLSKSPKYYFDNEVIKEPCAGKLPYGKKVNFKMNNKAAQGKHGKTSMFGGGTKDEYIEKYYKNGRNKRSVWTVTTKPFKEAHFATFPPDLILPCVLAGCPKGGVVMDMFGGAGTTGLVAVQNQRNFILTELSERYCEIAAKRIDAATSQKTFEDYL